MKEQYLSDLKKDRDTTEKTEQALTDARHQVDGLNQKCQGLQEENKALKDLIKALTTEKELLAYGNKRLTADNKILAKRIGAIISAIGSFNTTDIDECGATGLLTDDDANDRNGTNILPPSSVNSVYNNSDGEHLKQTVVVRPLSPHAAANQTASENARAANDSDDDFTESLDTSIMEIANHPLTGISSDSRITNKRLNKKRPRRRQSSASEASLEWSTDDESRPPPTQLWAKQFIHL